MACHPMPITLSFVCSNPAFPKIFFFFGEMRNTYLDCGFGKLLVLLNQTQTVFFLGDVEKRYTLDGRHCRCSSDSAVKQARGGNLMITIMTVSCCCDCKKVCTLAIVLATVI